MNFNLYFTHPEGKQLPECFHNLIHQFETIINQIVDCGSELQSYYLAGEVDNNQCFLTGYGTVSNLMAIIHACPQSELN